MPFQQFYKVGWGTCLKPVAAELLAVEGVEQAERVVDADGVLSEVVAVVILP